MACACASQQPTPVREPDSGELQSLQALHNEQARRIEELETRIALLEADARAARGEPSSRAGETIRIGAEPASAPAAARSTGWGDETIDAEESNGKRPRLRLYGQKGEVRELPVREPAARERTLSAADSLPRANMPSVPTVSETLPVVPLPEQRAAQLRAAAAPGGADSVPESPRDAAGIESARAHPVTSYRAALRLLRERRFDQAIDAFSTFIVANPSHALAPNALYWRGEAHYAKREYAPALADFEGLMQRYPRAGKAADALLKTALCLRQLGSEDKARDVFRRLRTDYPNSQAASMAAREGST